MWRTLHCFVPFLFVLLMTGCESKQEYSWAFAQNMDDTFKPNEHCRETLADVLDNYETNDFISGGDNSNIFRYNGSVESYYIHAFHSQSECETVLTNMMVRKAAIKRN